MYAREWKCRVPLDDRDGFLAYLHDTGLREASATRGYRGAQVFLREAEGRAEITLITYWDALSSIRAFAGEDIDKARLYPEDHRYHLEPDVTVRHYEVLGHGFLPGPTSGHAALTGDRMHEDTGGITIRHAEPSDYRQVISVLNEWWGGRKMSDMLPRLFFVHFRPTSFVSERGAEVVGFLIGFVSQTYPDQAYIHFVGIHPGCRRMGLGRRLYEHFLASAHERGCRTVRCVTSPVNRASIAFHRSMGFAVEPGDGEVEGVPFSRGYDGSDGDRVLFVKELPG